MGISPTNLGSGLPRERCHHCTRNKVNHPTKWALKSIMWYTKPHHKPSPKSPIVKGSLVKQLLSYGRWSWLAFPPSCQPPHHVNPISSCQPHIIMSTTSSSFQAPIILGSVRVRKRVNSPVKHCVFFRVMWPLGSRK